MNTLKHYFEKTWAKLTELYGRSIILFMLAMLLIIFSICVAVFTFFNSAAPTSLTITSGPPGSIFQKNAEKYKAILAKEGVKLTVLTSDGSIDNLHKLLDPKSKVDVGFV
ncbi:MAG TPA: C4-dicarboxylate ABC transporter substrate-binding protein, partial [Methylophilaceae bacterium]|nr:C4-dicarboxylate ABC transporter substrate-binding protein [Methylophilaceae bacterium]